MLKDILKVYWWDDGVKNDQIDHGHNLSPTCVTNVDEASYFFLGQKINRFERRFSGLQKRESVFECPKDKM